MSPLIVASLFPWIAVIQGTSHDSDSPVRESTFQVFAAYPELSRPYLMRQVGWPTIAFLGDGIPYFPDPKYRGNEAIEIYAKTGGERAREFFRAELAQSKTLPRSRALYGLAILEGTKLTETLLKMLKDPERRAEAAIALGAGRDPKAIPALVELFKEDRDNRDDGTPIQDVASQALTRFGSAALPALHQALRSPGAEVRWRTLATLESIGDPQSAEPLWLALNRESEPKIREAMVIALAKLGDERAVAPLLNQIGGKTPLYRQIEALAGLHLHPQAREVLRRWATRGGQTAEAYARCGYTDLRADWEAGLKDAEEEYFANALGILADPRSTPALAEAMMLQRNYKAPMRALLKIGKPAVPTLIRLLDSPETAVRARAAMTLGWIGDPAALPHLKKLAERQPNDASKARLDLVLANAARKVRVP